jgi:hypothetical protein
MQAWVSEGQTAAEFFPEIFENRYKKRLSAGIGK